MPGVTHGLTHAETTVLAALEDGDTAEALAHRLGFSWPHGNWITTTLRGLARKGLVTRTPTGEGASETETFRITLLGQRIFTKDV